MIAYEKNFIKYSKREAYSASEKEFVKKILNSKIIFISDFHSFKANSRTLMRILEILKANKKNYLTMLEMIHHKNQYLVDAFQKKHITEKEFLESLELSREWHFPWENIRNVFKKSKIIGLNTKGNLKERDLFFENLILKTYYKNSDKTLIVFIGEYHLAPNKLPYIFLEKKIKTLIIHQNLDSQYSKEPSYIKKFNNNEFILETAPKWLKYKSYSGLISNFDHNKVSKFLQDETYDEFLELAKKAAKFISLKKDTDLDHFSLFDRTNNPKAFTQKNRNYSNTYKSEFYFYEYSFNALTYAVGSHLFLLKNKITSPPLSKKDEFIYLIFKYMYAFYISKKFNPYKKTPLFRDLSKNRPFILFINKNVLRSPYKDENAKMIGHFLGEYLFRTSKKDILKLNPSLENLLFIKSSLLKGTHYKFESQRIF